MTSWIQSCLISYDWLFINVSSDTLYYTQAQTFVSNHLIMSSVMSDFIWLDFFLNVSSDTLYYTQAQTFYLNNYLMNSVMSDILWLTFYKCAIWYPLLHSSPNFWFKSFNHEFSHVWFHMTGVVLMCHLIPSTTLKPKLVISII